FAKKWRCRAGGALTPFSFSRTIAGGIRREPPARGSGLKTAHCLSPVQRVQEPTPPWSHFCSASVLSQKAVLRSMIHGLAGHWRPGLGPHQCNDPANCRPAGEQIERENRYPVVVPTAPGDQRRDKIDPGDEQDHEHAHGWPPVHGALRARST